MKKLILFLVAFCFAIAGSAQVKTYSSKDANLDGKVNAQDLNSIISEMHDTSKYVRVVPVTSICSYLHSINEDVAKQVEQLIAHDYVDLGLPSGTPMMPLQPTGTAIGVCRHSQNGQN